MDDLDELLVGREGAQDILAHRLRLHPLDEVLGDLEVDVGFEQRHAHVAQRLLDVRLGDPAGAADLAEHSFELVGERIEHGWATWTPGGGDRATS